ncbi:MAG TPA: glycosyltransferase [Verrucomicrobiales bacterium]|nr:glycosyltransferase [Verrucomicrobiales bacterium]
MRSFLDYRNVHCGETIVVCGCGASLNDFAEPHRFITVGVNDVGRRFHPTYLVVVNPPSQFSPQRFQFIRDSRARCIFTQLDLGIPHSRIVRFRLGTRGGVDFSDPHVLHYTQNSPYVALCLAAHLGAARIGLIGVDWTNDHFFGSTGGHPLSRRLAQIEKEYRALSDALRKRGVAVYNLSPVSRLTCIPKISFEELVHGPIDSVPVCRPATQVRPVKAPAQARLPRKETLMVAIEKHLPGLVGDFLDAFAATARALGYRVERNPRAYAARKDVLSVVWNGRHHRGSGPTLYCEHGWLPRWEYQVSFRGINSDSHLAPFVWDGEPLLPAQHLALEARMESLRSGSPGSLDYFRPDKTAAAGLPSDFFLVPLQMEWDTNIQRHAPRELRRMQALIDYVERADPPLPVLFKQHPADLRRGNQHVRLRLSRPQDLLFPHLSANIHQILKSGRCRGIITINSNVVHDGILWQVPSVVLGKNVWPRQEPAPFLTRLPEDWTELESHAGDPAARACREAYAHYLTTHQWKLEDARDPDKVKRLLARWDRTAPPAVRQQPPRRSSAPREPLINVVARNGGWLIEDLKGHFRSRDSSGFKVLATEAPVVHADAWIYLRPQEAHASPDLSRTAVQIHDLYDEGLYRPGRARRAVRSCAGIVFTHPRQKEIVEEAGVVLDGKRILLRPVGFLKGFDLRTQQPAKFTVAWVGRPVALNGLEIKRLQWFVDAVAALPIPRDRFEVVLLGERMKDYQRKLNSLGVSARYLERLHHPHSEYPHHYKSFDCLAITSSSNAGPHSLFEALACGVPVVSTPTGWAPQLISDGKNGFLVESVDSMTQAIHRVYAARSEWFARREEIRRTVEEHRLENWIDENLKLAAELAVPGRSQPAANTGQKIVLEH